MGFVKNNQKSIIKYYPAALLPVSCFQLAPRDVVSRTIISEMRAQKSAHMYLDISYRPADWIRGRFPSIYERCLQHGYDMTVQPLPVVPAAHYFCGGVATDLAGRTSIPGLFAAGENEQETLSDGAPIKHDPIHTEGCK